MSNKLVSIEKIKVLSSMVDNLISNLEDPSFLSLVLDIKIYIDKSILEEDKLYINKLKRSIYLQMKNAETEEQNKRLYDMYQSLKQLV